MAKKITLKEAMDRINEIGQVLADEGVQKRVAFVAANRVEAELKIRVFEQGLAADGSQIKPEGYSEKPIYVNPNSLTSQIPKSKVRPMGKNGLAEFLNGKKKKTRYYEKGYKEFREHMGRQTAHVDLNLSGASQKTLQVGTSKDDGIAFGFTNDERMAILRGNEPKKGFIFSASELEREIAREEARAEIRAVIKELRHG